MNRKKTKAKAVTKKPTKRELLKKLEASQKVQKPTRSANRDYNYNC